MNYFNDFLKKYTKKLISLWFLVLAISLFISSFVGIVSQNADYIINCILVGLVFGASLSIALLPISIVEFLIDIKIL